MSPSDQGKKPKLSSVKKFPGSEEALAANRKEGEIEDLEEEVRGEARREEGKRFLE